MRHLPEGEHSRRGRVVQWEDRVVMCGLDGRMRPRDESPEELSFSMRTVYEMFSVPNARAGSDWGVSMSDSTAAAREKTCTRETSARDI